MLSSVLFCVMMLFKYLTDSLWLHACLRSAELWWTCLSLGDCARHACCMHDISSARETWLAAASVRSAQQGQTFKSSSQDLAALSIGAKLRLRSNPLFSNKNQGQIPPMCRRIYQAGARARKRSFACRLRRSLRAISEVCPSSSCRCIQHLKESCSHNASWGKHGWLHAPVHSVEPRPATLGSGLRESFSFWLQQLWIWALTKRPVFSKDRHDNKSFRN